MKKMFYRAALAFLTTRQLRTIHYLICMRLNTVAMQTQGEYWREVGTVSRVPDLEVWIARQWLTSIDELSHLSGILEIIEAARPKAFSYSVTASERVWPVNKWVWEDRPEHNAYKALLASRENETARR